MSPRFHCGRCGATIELVGRSGNRTRLIMEHRAECHDEPRAGVLEPDDRIRR